MLRASFFLNIIIYSAVSSDLFNKKIKEKGESELWLEIPVDTRFSKEVLYANLKYKFIDDNPEAGLDLEKPLIEIQ